MDRKSTLTKPLACVGSPAEANVFNLNIVLTPFLIRVRIIEKDQSTIGRLLYYANRKAPMGIS